MVRLWWLDRICILNKRLIGSNALTTRCRMFLGYVPQSLDKTDNVRRTMSVERAESGALKRDI